MRRPGPTQPPGCGCRLVFALPPSGSCLGPATEDVVFASPPLLEASNRPACRKLLGFPSSAGWPGPRSDAALLSPKSPTSALFCQMKVREFFSFFQLQYLLELLELGCTCNFLKYLAIYIYNFFFILGT